MTHVEKAARRKAIAAAIAAGTPIAQACQQHGVSLSCGYGACRAHGVCVPASPRPSVMRILALLLTEPGRSLSDIAREMGRSRQRVQQIYAGALAAGVPITKRRESEECD